MIVSPVFLGKEFFPSVQGISSFSFCSGNLQFFLLFRESPVFPSVQGISCFSFCSGNLQFFLLFRESPVFPSVQGISSFSFYSGNLQFFLLFRESPVFPRLHSDTNFPGHTAKPSTVSKFVKKTQSQLHTVAAYTGRRYHHLPLQVVVCLVCGNNIDQLLGRWAVEMWGL